MRVEEPLNAVSRAQVQIFSSDLRAVAARWTLIIVEFGAVQMLVQALLAVSGLIIVRTLSKEQYALFTIANSMQATANLLGDLGIGLGLRSIGGRVCDDRRRFGALLNTAFAMRRGFAVVAATFCLPVALWMLRKNGATWLEAAGLCAAVSAGVAGLIGSSVWNISPLLHQEYRRLQKLDLANAAARTVMLAAMTAGRINALFAATVGVIGNWSQSFFLKRWAQDHAERNAEANRDDRRDLWQISLKCLPNTLFFCFQGQLTLLILSFTGNAAGIAEVTALGRVAALLAVFSTVFVSLIVPRFMRCQERDRLRALYLFLLAGTAGALTPFLLFAWFFPEPFLWLLGGQYQHLGRECGWVVAAGCVGQIGGVMWALNSSKAWIRYQAATFIPVILSTQVAAAYFLDLHQFHDVLVFNVISAAAPLAIYAADAWAALRCAPGSKFQVQSST
jgi:hypothetical protein